MKSDEASGNLKFFGFALLMLVLLAITLLVLWWATMFTAATMQLSGTDPVQIAELPQEIVLTPKGRPFKRDGKTIQMVISEDGKCLRSVVLDDERPLPKRFRVAKKPGSNEPVLVNLE